MKPDHCPKCDGDEPTLLAPQPEAPRPQDEDAEVRYRCRHYGELSSANPCRYGCNDCPNCGKLAHEGACYPNEYCEYCGVLGCDRKHAPATSGVIQESGQATAVCPDCQKPLNLLCSNEFHRSEWAAVSLPQSAAEPATTMLDSFTVRAEGDPGLVADALHAARIAVGRVRDSLADGVKLRVIQGPSPYDAVSALPESAAPQPEMRSYLPNFGEMRKGVVGVTLPLGSVEGIERLARDIQAFGMGVGHAPGRSSEAMEWYEKGKAAHAALMENVRELARLSSPSRRTE